MSDRSYVGVVSLHTLPDLTREPTHDQIRAWLVKNARRVGSYWSIAQILGARNALLEENAVPASVTPHVLLPAHWATRYTRTVTITANDPEPGEQPMTINWEIDDFDDRPTSGPPCGVGPEGHTWRLAIEPYAGDGIGASLTSGCDECDEAILANTGGEDVYMEAIEGRLTFEPDCPNLGGWHGLTRCDCGWQWRFDPGVQP